MSDEDDATTNDEGLRTIRDHARQHWYTLFPAFYVDEDSTVNDLLWQQLLEQRAHRLTLIWVGIIVPLSIVLGIALLIYAGVNDAW